MKGSALGIIETTGRACLIEAVDSAIKCASVTLKDSYFVGGGLNAVTLVGDVGAMSAALDAAKAVLERMNAEGTIHLIPRLADEVWAIIDGGINPPSDFSKYFSETNKSKTVIKEKRKEIPNVLPQRQAPTNSVLEQKPKPTISQTQVEETNQVKEDNSKKAKVQVGSLFEKKTQEQINDASNVLRKKDEQIQPRQSNLKNRNRRARRRNRK